MAVQVKLIPPDKLMTGSVTLRELCINPSLTNCTGDPDGIKFDVNSYIPPTSFQSRSNFSFPDFSAYLRLGGPGPCVVKRCYFHYDVAIHHTKEGAA